MYFLLSFVDVDECQMGSHACGVGQICHNLPGSYRCDCQTGYQFDALRKVCTGMLYCGRCAAHKLKYLGRFLNYSSCWLNFKKVWVFALLQTGDQFRVYPPWPNSGKVSVSCPETLKKGFSRFWEGMDGVIFLQALKRHTPSILDQRN